MPDLRIALLFSSLSFFAVVVQAHPESAVADRLLRNQLDLATEGKEFLVSEARKASFFLLGELHGEREMPELVVALWPPMWEAGYRHVAVGRNRRLRSASPFGGVRRKRAAQRQSRAAGHHLPAVHAHTAAECVPWKAPAVVGRPAPALTRHVGVARANAS